MTYIQVKLSSRCELYLTIKEINTMLMQNPEIFKQAVSRGKAIKRSENENARNEKKFGNHESEILNNYLQ